MTLTANWAQLVFQFEGDREPGPSLCMHFGHRRYADTLGHPFPDRYWARRVATLRVPESAARVRDLQKLIRMCNSSVRL